MASITSAEGETKQAAAALELPTELQGMELDAEAYVELLRLVIAESKHVQNNPSQGLIPEEGKVAQHLLKTLEPYSGENGPLEVQVLEYKENRPNIKITYRGSDPSAIVGFVGSHMDVGKYILAHPSH